MRALRVASEATYRDNKLAQDQAELELKAPLYQAQADTYAAHANLYNMQASPEYLLRQERIAAIKDRAAQQKEQQKLQFDLAKSWVKGQTGLEHPDDINQAMAYIQATDQFKQNFDLFIDKIAEKNPQSANFWIQGMKNQDPSVLAELKKRGIYQPALPQFPNRILAGVPQGEK